MLIRKSILVIVMAMLLVSCASVSPTQQNTLQKTGMGAAAGAAAGAIIGAIAGDAGMGAAIGAGAGALGGFIWSASMESQKEQMEAATSGTGISVAQTADNRLKLNIPSDISFDTGRAEIKPEMYPILNRLAAGLKNNPTSQVNIVGHTDNTGTDMINNPLSINRAANTRDYLVQQGIQPNRINIEGHGSREPEVPNDTPSNRAKNRRVEIFVYEVQQQLMQQPAPQTPQ